VEISFNKTALVGTYFAEYLLDNDDNIKNIGFAGHSLGGSVAQIQALYFADNKQIRISPHKTFEAYGVKNVVDGITLAFDGSLYHFVSNVLTSVTKVVTGFIEYSLYDIPKTAIGYLWDGGKTVVVYGAGAVVDTTKYIWDGTAFVTSTVICSYDDSFDFCHDYDTEIKKTIIEMNAEDDAQSPAIGLDTTDYDGFHQKISSNYNNNLGNIRISNYARGGDFIAQTAKTIDAQIQIDIAEGLLNVLGYANPINLVNFLVIHTSSNYRYQGYIEANGSLLTKQVDKDNSNILYGLKNVSNNEDYLFVFGSMSNLSDTEFKGKE